MLRRFALLKLEIALSSAPLLSTISVPLINGEVDGGGSGADILNDPENILQL